MELEPPVSAEASVLAMGEPDAEAAKRKDDDDAPAAGVVARPVAARPAALRSSSPAVVVDDASGPEGADAKPPVSVVANDDASASESSALARGPPAAAASGAGSSSIAAGDSALMEIVGPGLIKLAAKFKPDGEEDNAKNAAANFIQKLNEYVIKLKAGPASEGGSRRALKRSMKKYSRRVGRSRRQRGKRVKPSAQ